MRILIADDHELIRCGIKSILNEDFKNLIIEEVSDGKSLLKKLREQAFDLVISDLSMPHLNGLDSLKQIKIEFPCTPVLILSMHPVEEYGLRVMRSGASGYVCKSRTSEDLSNAVRKISKGKKYYSIEMMDLVMDSDPSDDQGLSKLSDRELQVFRLLAEGIKTKVIAEELHLSANTVSTYRQRIMEKLNLQNTMEIVRYAMENQ